MSFHICFALANASNRPSLSSQPCSPSPSILSDSNGLTSRTERLSMNLLSLPGTTLFKCEVWKARIIEDRALVQDAKDRRYLSTGRRLRFCLLRVDGDLHLGVRADVIVWGMQKHHLWIFFRSFYANPNQNCFHRNDMVLYKVRPCLIVANRLKRPSFSMYETTRWKIDYSASLQMISTLQRTIFLHQNR